MLSVKGSRVVPSSKPTLICTVWMTKLYKPESFRAHMKSIWKTRKKFEIQMVGQNLFLISFELADDLELILEGRPWFFRNNVILFDRLCQAVDRDQIRLTSSPYWMKIDSISPKFDKKDLMHAIGATFGGILRSEINEDSCRLRVNFDVQRPLRRGIFVSTSAVSKVWVPFKYENLPMFCFGCGRLGHGLSNCTQLTHERISKINENPPYSLALKAESKLFGKESIKFNAWIKKVGAQCLYTGGEKAAQISTVEVAGDNNEMGGHRNVGNCWEERR
ncbi:hypothetical protein Gotri_004690 [Gossypium trilobum]|uniref:CCHC-type domain-containing protein n=1 Tax=Gossypium trilobum TaxID=34281 RepID=A0A7J9F5N2_9ROSI|nr:hypothetical protein [Gossypium trilobum]